MALRRRFADKMITRTYAVPATWVSGLPVCVGQIPGVLLTSRDSDGEAQVQLDGSHYLNVQAKDSSGTSGADANVAVAVGDILYYDETPATAGKYLSKRAGGIRFGYAEEVVNSGASAEISVKVGY